MLGLALPAIACADAQSDYASLFGDEEAKVLQTPTARDDAAFAAKLLARTADLKDAPELKRLVLTRVVELGQRDADGLDSAVTAAKEILASAQGGDKLTWHDKLLDLYTAQYKRATGPKRAEAGGFLIGVMQEEAESLAKQGKYADASKRLKDAQDVARTIRSPRADALAELAKDLQARQIVADKLDRMKSKYETQGGDVSVLEQLILGYLLELDDEATAGTLAARHPDKQWERVLKLLQAAPETLADQDLIDAGDWLVKVSERPSVAASKPLLMGRAHTCYRRFLTKHGKKDAVALKVQDSLNKLLKLAGSPTATTADSVVVHNQHNFKHNDRGSKAIVVSLLLKGKQVWRSGLTPLAWRADTDTSVTVKLPSVLFDRVRVDVTEWQGNGPGLSEVEVFSGTKNLVRGAPVNASGQLRGAQTPPSYYLPSYVTDGVVSSGAGYTGYWCAPDSQPAWIEIGLPNAP
jgi:hypothetical protein